MLATTQPVNRVIPLTFTIDRRVQARPGGRQDRDRAAQVSLSESPWYGLLGFSMEAALRLVGLRETESGGGQVRAVHARRNEIGSSLQVRTQVGNDSGFSSMEELLSGPPFVTMVQAADLR